ncbi:MAG: threonine/serine dehydratase [Thermaerobacter sp.]
MRPVDAAGKMEPILVALDQILAARRRIAPYLEPTPLQASRTFSRMTGWQVWLKPENLQRTGSFKARGALNAVLRLAEGEGETGGPQAPSRRRGVITASSGNHGQAVAFAAASAGLPATVVVPEQASPAKVAAMEGYGARVVRHGRFPDERKAHARRLAREEGLHYIDSTDDPDVIAGQGTVAVEVLEDLPDVAALVVPVGGGGLISGVAAAVKGMRPGVRVIGVEPVGSAAMHASLQAGRPVTLDQVDSVADGLWCRRPGDLCFAHVRRFVDDIVRVDEAEILAAMALLAERAKLVVEPSGAVSLAAGLARRLPGVAAGRPVAFVLTGGNVALDRYTAWLAEPQRVWSPEG